MAAALLSVPLLLLLTSHAAAVCPDRAAMPSLDTSRLLGMWHIVRERDYDIPGLEYVKCSHHLLQQGENGDIDSLYMYYNSTRGNYVSRRNTLKRETPGGTDGKLLVMPDSQQLTAKYYVLKTDYDNYATVWMCRTMPVGEGNIEVAVVLSRQRTLSGPLLAEANAALPPGLTYRDANQSDCPEHDHEGHEDPQ